jgi:hypothetical protein
MGQSWMAWSYWIYVLKDAARTVGEQSLHYVNRDGEIVMPAVLLGYAIECAMKCYRK